jgi:hypothetical protein
MKTRVIPVNVLLDFDTDREAGDWAEREGKSKRRHVAILMRKLVALREAQPDELVRLGLMESLSLASR